MEHDGESVAWNIIDNFDFLQGRGKPFRNTKPKAYSRNSRYERKYVYVCKKSAHFIEIFASDVILRNGNKEYIDKGTKQNQFEFRGFFEMRFNLSIDER